MFNGEEDTRFKSTAPADAIFDKVEDILGDLGRARVSERGAIDILPRQSFDNALTQTTMRGRVRERKDGEYEVRVTYVCSLSPLGWVILILGLMFALAGALVLLAPMQKKDEVARKVRRTLSELED